MLTRGPAKKVTIFIDEDSQHHMIALHSNSAVPREKEPGGSGRGRPVCCGPFLEKRAETWCHESTGSPNAGSLSSRWFSGTRWRGMHHAFAMAVGITALPITVATK
jgi:hypothetical protein